MRQIEENRLTHGACAVTSIGDGKVVVGHLNGDCSLWEYSRGTLSYIQNFISGEKAIRVILDYPVGKFISIDYDGVIRIWKISGNCIQVLRGGSLDHISSAVILPDNLLAVSGNCSPAWECFMVWDLDLGTCISNQLMLEHRAYGMSLKTTVDGYLVVSGHCAYTASIWKINRTECARMTKCEIDRIYSMTVLPTGDIVTGNHDLKFYQISTNKEICKYKTITNGNVIDFMYPVAGYKILVVDRSHFNGNTIKLWNFVSESPEILGHGLSEKVVIFEQHGAVLSIGENKICIDKFSEHVFHFPKKLAEIRKNARILSQAYRTQTSNFSILPAEMIIKIIIFSSDNMNECEAAVSEKIAWNYFCKP